MGVVTTYGNGYKDPASLVLADPVFAEGDVKSILSKCAIANGDSATSLLYFGKVPSNAIILPTSTLYHGTITSLNDVDLGIFRNGAEAVSGSADALADGLDLTSGTSKSAVAALTATTDYVKRVWELLGLATDPGCMYDIVGTLKANAGGAGVILAALYYTKK